MSLTRIDLLNKSFSTALLGYSKPQVEQLLQEMADVLGDYAESTKDLRLKARDLEKRLAEYQQREASLRDTLVATQKMVEDLKSSARAESRVILEQAQAKADRVVTAAHNRAAEVREEIEDLKRQRLTFQMQLKGLIETHLRLLEEEDPQMRKVEELESKLKYLKAE